MEVADHGVHMDTSHYQRLSVIEITFLCKLNVASGSFEMVSVFPPPTRVWQSSNSSSCLRPEVGHFQSPQKVIQDRRLSCESRKQQFTPLSGKSSNCYFPAQAVFFLATPYLPSSHWIRMEVLTKLLKYIGTSGCSEGTTHGSERNFLLPKDSWSLYTPERRGMKTFLSHIPSDDGCFICALRGLLPSNKYMKQFWNCLVVLSFPEKSWKQNYSSSLWKRRMGQIFAILAMCL